MPTRAALLLCGVLMALGLVGCAGGPPPPPLRPTPAMLVAGVAGTYAAAPIAGSPAAAGATVRFVVLSDTGLDGAALYEEWRSNAPPRAALTQRVWLVRTVAGGMRIELLALKAPSRYLGAGRDGFVGLRMEQLIPSDGRCGLVVQPGAGGDWRAALAPALASSCPRGASETVLGIARSETGLMFSSAAAGQSAPAETSLARQ